jgi:hypothetical protein
VPAVVVALALLTLAVVARGATANAVGYVRVPRRRVVKAFFFKHLALPFILVSSFVSPFAFSAQGPALSKAKQDAETKG